jgi:ankyrin repeat protein
VNFIVRPGEGLRVATPAQQMLAAVLAGDAGTVGELLDADPHLADLADRRPGRFSVLHLAARRGHLAVAELLLAAGATVNRWSHDGLVPLHMAALGGHLEVARALIAAGAETRATDNGGHSVLCAAKVGGNQALISLLRTLPRPDWGLIHARGYLHGRPRVT